MKVERKLELDRAVMRTRVLAGVLCVYALLQSSLYIVGTVQAPCAILMRLFAGSAITQILSMLLMLMIATCIKKRSCYWCQIVLGCFLLAVKLVIMVVLAVQGRPKKDSEQGCSIDRPTMTVMIAATLLEMATLAICMVILRRLRRSKSLGLHNHTAVQKQQRFIDDQQSDR